MMSDDAIRRRNCAFSGGKLLRAHSMLKRMPPAAAAAAGAAWRRRRLRRRIGREPRARRQAATPLFQSPSLFGSSPFNKRPPVHLPRGLGRALAAAGLAAAAAAAAAGGCGGAAAERVHSAHIHESGSAERLTETHAV